MANKYLDNVGLDHMWDKIKSYLTSNYAAKSHTHTIAQIADLQTTLNGKANKTTTLAGYGIIDAYTKTEVDNFGYAKISGTSYSNSSNISKDETYTIPAMSVDQFHGIYVSRKVTSSGTSHFYIRLPSGGKYLELSTGKIYSGGSQIADLFASESNTINYSGTILRIS